MTGHRHRHPTRMRAFMIFAVVVVAAVGCARGPFGDGPGVDCQGDRCVCVGDDVEGGDCLADCGLGTCPALECRNGDSCDLQCEGGCEHSCHDVNVCTTDCGVDCDLECRNLSDCTSACGADCEQRCADVGNCNLAVGPGSVVVCERVGNCTVDCDGDCRVTCENAGTCNVSCDDGSATVCADGVTRVCGQSC